VTAAPPLCDLSPVEPEVMLTWSVAVEKWRDWLTMRGLSAATIGLRCDQLRFIAAHVDTPGPAAVTAEDLLALFGGRAWSPAHRKTMRESVRSFYRWATEANVTPTDVSACLPSVKPPPPRARPVPDEIWAALMAHDDDRLRLMARLAGQAGLRRAEVAATHTDDVICDAEGWSLIVRGKGDRQRVVPIGEDLAQALQTLPRGYVFASRKGGHLSPREVGMLVSAAMPPGWSMHMLRHRFATRGYAGTGNLRAVQEALGHASVATTQRYTAVSSRDVRSVTEAASAGIAPIGRS
jgi:integrase